MSECVVRMEMPSGCDKCPFMWGNCIVDEKDECYGRVHYNDVVVRISGNKYDVRKDRPSWCPIIFQLPEGHGRLVDKDEMLKKIENYHRYMTVGRESDPRCIIEDSLTIVPAEAERSET